MDVNIRKATIKDAKSIVNIWKIICAERIYTAISKPFTIKQEEDYIRALSDREGIFIAKVNKQIIGFQSLDLWFKAVDSFDHVGSIGTFVLPKWRRMGVAQLLFNYVLKFARSKKYQKFVIYVRNGNKGAKKFYKSLGFTPKGILTDQVKIDGIYEDEVFMEMFL
jgi:ribosomal protein S18 acetylase RimI-like enzyme